MKKMIVACMVLSVSSFLFSYEYLMNTNPLGIGSHTGYVLINTLTGGNWDNGYYDLAIPEANKFYYYGKKVTHLRISTNGYVVLGFGSASGNGTLHSNQLVPNPVADNNIAAPLWDDYVLTCGGGVGEIYYEIAADPNNVNYISIEWRGVRRAGTTDTAYSFSCAFYSANNCTYPNSIAFAYADVDSGNATYDSGKSATVGIENSTGTQGVQYSCNEAIVVSGQKILFTPFVPIYGSTTDIYPGVYDGKPDAVVFRPSNGYWYYFNSDGSQRSFEYGKKGDIAVPGDYGAGFSLECIFRPDNGHWYCRIPYIDIKWGTSGDIPVPADYDGDGSMDIAVFRPGNGTWYVYIRGTGTIYSWQWGQPGDIPLPADYDNDNYADCAVYRPANNTWYIRKSSDWSMVEKKWGTEGDIPMPTNIYFMIYSTLTVFRPSNGYWYTLNQQTGDIKSGPWGQDGDVPVPADENAGGNTDATVFRPENGYWYIAGSPSGGLPASFQWGQLGDQPRFRCSFLVVSPPASSGPNH